MASPSVSLSSPIQPAICPTVSTSRQIVACVSEGNLFVGDAEADIWIPLTQLPKNG
ncbi:unnamed protein product [Protopolystoma xenopodis]|uniref:Uncharacterized protein n=1 Tax=Protopolystoma xenopodis TaxID=117903 RepID=A0A3S5BV65_9PLAT|nr:unnamed protein product [Protopolystoma xenopodis]